GATEDTAARRFAAARTGQTLRGDPLAAPFVIARRKPYPLLVGAEGVVLLEVAERGLGPALRVRRHGRPVAAGVDAGLGLGGRSRGRCRSWARRDQASVTQRGVVLPLLGPWPLGIATELPATGVALAHGSGSSPAAGSGSDRSPAIARVTSASAAKLWPLTSA